MKNAIIARVTTTPDRGIMEIASDVEMSPAAKQTVLSSMMYSFFAEQLSNSGINASISDICGMCKFVDIGVYVNAADKDIALELLEKQLKQILEATKTLNNNSTYRFDIPVENFILQVRELLK